MNAAREVLSKPTPARVLVVDDDPVSRFYFRAALERSGATVSVAENGMDVQKRYGKVGSFDCALIDYQMPGLNGIELLNWLRGVDPNLATILVTADGEKEVVEQALTGGATGFLNKPVDLPDLISGVAKALLSSRERRRLVQIESEVQKIGLQQRSIQRRSAGVELGGIRLSHYPYHQAGGDFLVRLAISGNQTLILAADISGHDLEAAFLAAHFQGLVRGMISCGAKLDEILELSNRILIEEWTGVQGSCDDKGRPRTVPPSIAVSALLIDSRNCTLTVMVNGNPLPVLLDPDGKNMRIGQPACPLGWFDGPAVRPCTYAWTPGSSVLLWTDGAESLAELLEVDPLAVAYQLGQASKEKERPSWLKLAVDDVLAADVGLNTNGELPNFEPIVYETHVRGRDSIDVMQEGWRRSLDFAIGTLAPESMFDILLAGREGMLNALKHGCGPGEEASFGMSYSPSAGVLRIIVSDPGRGHANPIGPSRKSMNLPTAHRGLDLISFLPKSVRSLRNGAEIWMDMEVKLDAKKTRNRKQ